MTLHCAIEVLCAVTPPVLSLSSISAIGKIPGYTSLSGRQLIIPGVPLYCIQFVMFRHNLSFQHFIRPHLWRNFSMAKDDITFADSRQHQVQHEHPFCVRYLFSDTAYLHSSFISILQDVARPVSFLLLPSSS